MTEELKKISIGNAYKVIGFKKNNLVLRRKLLDMGITRNIVFTIDKISPFGDKFVISLRNYQLCIDKENLLFLYLEKINKPVD